MSSSGGWEKVGAAKKAGGTNKAKNKAKKANQANGGQLPKVEDVCKFKSPVKLIYVRLYNE